MAAESNGPTRLDKALTALRESTADGDERYRPDHSSSPLASDADPSFDTMEIDLSSMVRRTAHVVRDGLTPSTNECLEAAVDRAGHPTETGIQLAETHLRSKSHAPYLLHHMPDLKDARVKRMGETQAWATMSRLMREGSPSLAMLQLAERASPSPSLTSLSVDPTRPTKRTSAEDRARQPSGLLALKAMDRFNRNAPGVPSVDLLEGLQVRPQAAMVGPTPAAQHQETASQPITSDSLAAALRPMVEWWINNTMPSVLEQAIRLETKGHRD